MLSANSSILAVEHPQGPLLVQMERFRNVKSLKDLPESPVLYTCVSGCRTQGVKQLKRQKETQSPGVNLQVQVCVFKSLSFMPNESCKEVTFERSESMQK